MTPARTRVKFCGTTSPDEARAAAALGVDMIGLILAASPRRIDLDRAREIASALPEAVTPVGVFVDPAAEEIARALRTIPRLTVQLSGEESPEFVAAVPAPTIKAIHVDASGESEQRLRERAARYPRSLPLFDTRALTAAGGTGSVFRWDGLAALAREREILVAGGLTPENVGACVRAVRPCGVDVRSGIETDGKRDAAKTARFMSAVREADATA